MINVSSNSAQSSVFYWIFIWLYDLIFFFLGSHIFLNAIVCSFCVLS